jgi:hypothetical protein
VVAVMTRRVLNIFFMAFMVLWLVMALGLSTVVFIDFIVSVVASV